ncbi:hypothetical protein ONV78_28960 [Hahella sp. CR1]|uniref:hypothetical protein n=1 Tax=Hahella sp. CR1 TaxID=2992807 RepID=UPI002441EA5F|nr:hypothetical protein [Hahella sp. CR1]MDG9671801.1 hypothetical protein [Hahella sp. CR1]
MENGSIKVIKQSNSDIEFSFISGKEKDAAEYLVKYISSGGEISLANNEDEAGEGITSIIYKDGVFLFKNAGHGWTGDWNVISQEDLKAMIVKLAPHNDGSHWSLVGRLRKC